MIDKTTPQMSVCAKSIHLLNMEVIAPPKFNSDFTPETWWEWKTIRLPIGKVYFWVVKNGGMQKSISTIFGRLGPEPSIDHCCGINMANNMSSMFTMAASSKRTQVDGVYPPPKKDEIH